MSRMECSCCGAPLSPEAIQIGKCRFCSTAVVAPSASPLATAIDAALKSATAGSGSVSVSNTFVVDGRTYHRVEDMPPEVRAKVESKRAALAKLGIKLP
jgi:hypothetical protein